MIGPKSHLSLTNKVLQTITFNDAGAGFDSNFDSTKIDSAKVADSGATLNIVLKSTFANDTLKKPQVLIHWWIGVRKRLDAVNYEGFIKDKGNSADLDGGGSADTTNDYVIFSSKRAVNEV